MLGAHPAGQLPPSQHRMSRVPVPAADSPWTCTVCHKPIPSHDGAIEVFNNNAKLGPVGGYPMEPSKDPWHPSLENATSRVLTAQQLIDEARADGAFLPPNIGYRVYHWDCNPMPEGHAYQITLGDAASLQLWCSWVQHLAEKTWMGRRDLMSMLGFWFTNRGVHAEEPRQPLNSALPVDYPGLG